MKGIVLSMLIAGALFGARVFMKGKGPESLQAAPAASSDVKNVEKLTALIQEQRARIESLEDQFQIKGAELAKQFQQLEKRRKGLKANDGAELQRFNAEADAYTAQNNAHKAIGAELESARNGLSSLLDERARLRPSKPAVLAQPAQDVPSLRDPAAERKTARGPGYGKPVVVYTRTEKCVWVNAVKSYLARKGVPYEERNVDRSSQAMKEFKNLGATGVPVILVGDERADGFDRQWLDHMFGE